MIFSNLEEIYNYCKYCKFCEKDSEIELVADNKIFNKLLIKNNKLDINNKIFDVNNYEYFFYFRSECSKCFSLREMLNALSDPELKLKMFNEIYYSTPYTIEYDLINPGQINIKYFSKIEKYSVDLLQKSKSINKFLSKIKNLKSFT